MQWVRGGGFGGRFRDASVWERVTGAIGGVGVALVPRVDFGQLWSILTIRETSLTLRYVYGRMVLVGYAVWETR